jgi:hypothetical protein
LLAKVNQQHGQAQLLRLGWPFPLRSSCGDDLFGQVPRG